MDKYEMNLKIEQIKKLAAKKAYKEAAAIAKEMNWIKVKDWSILATVINVQEAVGDYEEARDMAIIAYNRNLGGRKLVYKLTQLMIKLQEFDEADELYDEYDRMSAHDANRYVLFYELRKAEGASDSELIGILEEYKEHEADERYLYELACLYADNDRKDECIRVCDEMILWFQEGAFVEQAIKLKKEQGAVLTKMQKKIQADAVTRKQDTEATKELLFKQQKEMVRLQKDELEDLLNDSEQEDTAASNTVLQPNEPKKPEIGWQSYEQATVKAPDPVFETQDPQIGELENPKGEDTDSDYVDFETADLRQTRDSALQQMAVDLNLDFTAPVAKAEEDGSRQTLEKEEPEDFAVLKKAPKDTAEEKNTVVHSDEISDQIPENIRELIVNAKKRLESNYDRISKEDEAERIEEEKREVLRKLKAREDAIAEEVSVPNYSIYDTQNIQEELAKNLTEYFEEEGAFDELRPSPAAVEKTDGGALEQADQKTTESKEQQTDFEDEQIEGQLSLADWMESVREEKYGKQHTKEYSKQELERMLDEKEEKSAAYEKLVAEQKAKAKESSKESNDAEAHIKARTQMMLHAAKTDLAIRTGKATLKLEEAVANLKEAAAASKQIESTETAAGSLTADGTAAALDKTVIGNEEVKVFAQKKDAEKAPVQEKEKKSSNVTELSNAAPAQEAPQEKMPQTKAAQQTKGAPASEEYTATAEETTVIELNTANFEPVTEQVIAAYQAEAATVGSTESDRKAKGKAENASAQQEVRAEVTVQNPALKGQVIVRDGEKRLTGDLAKLFRKYREMPGIENQLVDFFDSIDNEIKMSTSKTGNIIISGNSSSDKIDLARTIVRAINFLYPQHAKKIAKTTGDSINSRGIEKAMPKLKGTALIVEGAGAIEPKRIDELMACLERETDRMIVIFEDADSEMNVLINFNPNLVKKFNHRIVLKQYTVNELVEIARKFARKRMYEVNDDALLELYLKIDKLHNMTDNIKLDDIKEIINKAIETSEARAAKKLFGGLRKKRSSGDVTFLMPADFAE